MACRPPVLFLLFLILIFLLTIFPANCWANDFVYSKCDIDQHYLNGSKIQKNLESVFRALVDASADAAGFKISAVGRGADTVYGLVQCREDTSASQCHLCAQDAVKSVQQKCGNFSGARAWLDYCYLRFATFNFTAQLEKNWIHRFNPGKVSNPAVFQQHVLEMLNYSIGQAAQMQSPSARYASGVSETSGCNVSTIYGFVQCWRNVISTDDCQSCLDFALKDVIQNLNGNVGGRILSDSCLLRYEIYPFIAATPPPFFTPLSPASVQAGPSKSTSRLPVLGAVAGSVLAALLFFLVCIVRCRKRTNSNESIPISVQTSTTANAKVDYDILANEDKLVMFSMSDLIVATNNFDEAFKLGEGEFGPVYKGSLANGKDVAVKKLSLESMQGQEEFVNEIKVEANVQHRNLVSLLGWCAEVSHRILVYEYLPNSSLDKVLFDPEKRKLLDWSKRYKIIFGIARGLLYLHEEGKMKIIHRDIRASNILLDEKLNPKIADFGLARLFKEDASRVQTRIVGSYGYMAPEYAMHGQLTTKADVYSFGVMLMEIITAKKNSEFDPTINAPSVLGWVWKLYCQGDIMKLADDNIKETCPVEQVQRCAHIGLLCTQADPSLRPEMRRIIIMLSSRTVSLPKPTMPGFLSLTQVNSSTASQKDG